MAITGGLHTTAEDFLDVHAYLLPIDLLFSKLLHRATLHLCSLPKLHPLHNQLHSHSTKRAKRQLSPLHHLLHFANIDPMQVETVMPTWRSPGYSLTFKLIIPPSKEDTLPIALLFEMVAPVQV